MSGVVLGRVVKVVGSNSLEAKYLQHLSAQLIHIPPYIYIHFCEIILNLDKWFRRCRLKIFLI